MTKAVSLTLGWSLRILIRFYQYVFSPIFGANCRYQPTCSQYAYDAVARHGPLRGSWLALRRVGRCHPWGGAGYDPVPRADRPGQRAPR